jgi:hypothetical protein
MAATDLLSILPDDVLQHMLPFKPTRDADASDWRRTSALALRKYPERLSLDSRPYSLVTRPDTCLPGCLLSQANAALADRPPPQN